MITPQQFRALRGSDLARIERRLDEAIYDLATYRAGSITVDVSQLGGNETHIEAVLRDYRAAGWKAELVYDQRDGNYVRLEAV